MDIHQKKRRFFVNWRFFWFGVPSSGQSQIRLPERGTRFLWSYLFFLKGFAVGALVHGGICLMRTNQNAVQRTVIFLLAVVFTLLHGTLDTFVCLTIHRMIPP